MDIGGAHNVLPTDRFALAMTNQEAEAATVILQVERTDSSSNAENRPVLEYWTTKTLEIHRNMGSRSLCLTASRMKKLSIEINGIDIDRRTTHGNLPSTFSNTPSRVIEIVSVKQRSTETDRALLSLLIKGENNAKSKSWKLM